MPKIHSLKPERKTLHGPFDRSLPPVLSIDSGDTVYVQTLDAGWSVGPKKDPGGRRVKFPEFDRERDAGHSLVGPIKIDGAKPGDTLEIKINEIVPGPYGWTCGGGFPSYQNKKMGIADPPEKELDFLIDREKMTASSQFGDFSYEIPIRPFMGLMGMPPEEPGQHSTTPPRYCGGNIDCKELVAGSTLYLPIPVEGGLFSVGDGHAVQGDGEVAGPALECPMEHVSLTLTVCKDMKLSMPRAKTPAGWITFGFHEDLNEAMWTALDEMVSFMTELYSIPRKEAYALASLTVDLHISQIVNTVKGVHAILPYGAIR
ncbi:MAG TPA: acetamidase/formamidase family protein [Bacillales bacterium]|nr:acetamidase/formamidase family protein [Bacillales bacterium]